jgi:hypothetical protein
MPRIPKALRACIIAVADGRYEYCLPERRDHAEG